MFNDYLFVCEIIIQADVSIINIIYFKKKLYFIFKNLELLIAKTWKFLTMK